MRLRDSSSGFGWLSIAIHWITGVVILAMLFIGASIGQDADTDTRMLRLHTTIAVIAYVFLWWRIVRRFRQGHPGPLPKQSVLLSKVGMYVHYLLLAAIAAMLISGPLMAWSGGIPIQVGGLFAVPSPLPVNQAAYGLLRGVHVAGASFIAAATALHIGGVLKHLIFDRDGTFEKMIIPAPADAD